MKLHDLPMGPRLASALARLDDRIDWERRDRGSMRQDLGPMRDLVRRLGDPTRGIRFVHVGGSKGKGSVAALIASGLAAGGARTGLYTSPHVERVTERFSVDGEALDETLLAAAIEAALAACADAERERTPGQAATWFDIMTAAALVGFRDAGASWVVLEVGLGGRLDSTNVVTAEVCVLTNIELEHTELLGSTRAAIAGEKAGILDPGCALVCGLPDGDEAGEVIHARARELGVEVLHPELGAEVSPGPVETNLALARAALDALGRRGARGSDGRPVRGALLDEPEARRRARLPGRLERVRVNGTPVVLDGAHTSGSLAALREYLLGDPPVDPPVDSPGKGGGPGRGVAVVSLAKDKDAEAFLKALASLVDRAHCTSVGGDRHHPAEALRRLAAAAGLDAVASDPPEVAVSTAVAEAGERGWVLVTGSLYLVGAVRGALVAASTGEP